MLVGSPRTTIGLFIVAILSLIAVIANTVRDRDRDRSNLELAMNQQRMVEAQLGVSKNLLDTVRTMAPVVMSAAEAAQTAKTATTDTNRMIKHEVQPKMDAMVKHAGVLEKKVDGVKNTKSTVIYRPVYVPTVPAYSAPGMIHR